MASFAFAGEGGEGEEVDDADDVAKGAGWDSLLEIVKEKAHTAPLIAFDIIPNKLLEGIKGINARHGDHPLSDPNYSTLMNMHILPPRPTETNDWHKGKVEELHARRRDQSGMRKNNLDWLDRVRRLSRVRKQLLSRYGTEAEDVDDDWLYYQTRPPKLDYWYLDGYSTGETFGAYTSPVIRWFLELNGTLMHYFLYTLRDDIRLIYQAARSNPYNYGSENASLPCFNESEGDFQPMNVCHIKGDPTYTGIDERIKEWREWAADLDPHEKQYLTVLECRTWDHEVGNPNEKRTNRRLHRDQEVAGIRCKYVDLIDQRTNKLHNDLVGDSLLQSWVEEDAMGEDAMEEDDMLGGRKKKRRKSLLKKKRRKSLLKKKRRKSKKKMRSLSRIKRRKKRKKRTRRRTKRRKSRRN